MNCRNRLNEIELPNRDSQRRTSLWEILLTTILANFLSCYMGVYDQNHKTKGNNHEKLYAPAGWTFSGLEFTFFQPFSIKSEPPIGSDQ
jgi:hypothetical protein